MPSYLLSFYVYLSIYHSILSWHIHVLYLIVSWTKRLDDVMISIGSNRATGNNAKYFPNLSVNEERQCHPTNEQILRKSMQWPASQNILLDNSFLYLLSKNVIYIILNFPKFWSFRWSFNGVGLWIKLTCNILLQSRTGFSLSGHLARRLEFWICNRAHRTCLHGGHYWISLTVIHNHMPRLQERYHH